MRMIKNGLKSRLGIGLMVGFFLLFSFTGKAFPLAGDFNGNRGIDLADAIIGLRVLVRGTVDPSATGLSSAVDGNWQLGLSDVIYILQKLAGLRGYGYVAISGGVGHTMALYGDDTVRTWGDNGDGQLGDSTNTIDERNIPGTVSSLSNIVAVAAGGSHSLALGVDGTIKAWGSNESGQLGDGTNSDWDAPTPVNGLDGVVAIAGGFRHTVALKVALKNDGAVYDGTVLTWGNNKYGQLGYGTDTDTSSSPKQVGGLTNIVASVAAGDFHTVVLQKGTVWAWGANHFGQLGYSTDTDTSSSPKQVGGLTSIVAVAAGSYHTVALKNDGTVWTWGLNGDGQLGYSTGTGTNTSRNTPTKVSGITNVIAVAAGGYHTVALKNDRTVWTWGYNEDGELGNGTNANSNSPVQASNLTGVVAVAAGLYHTFALRSDGSIYAWGYNGYGQLGDGTNTNRNSPTPVSNP
jgi:alpha-tubulin suppressor-like RCC1 family protein